MNSETKKQKKSKIEQKGVSIKPFSPTHIFELVYQDAEIFRLIFTYFKIIKANVIYIKCTPKNMIFYTWSNNDNAKICINIDGVKMNWYYCKIIQNLCIIRKQVEKIFLSINKDTDKITFFIVEDDSEYLNIHIKNNELDQIKKYRIKLPVYKSDENLIQVNSVINTLSDKKMFPLKFTLPARTFKKSICDGLNFSITMRIEKTKDTPLTLSFCEINSIPFKEIYQSESKIKLESNLDENNKIIKCNVNIFFLKAIVCSNISKDITLYCNNNNQTCLCSFDENNVISIYAEIVNLIKNTTEDCLGETD
jgi:hypothetical protein